MVSLDVEEEGLFCGRYATRDVPVSNVSSLIKLVPLLERGIRPTLFCAWSVLKDDAARIQLDKIRLAGNSEIGLHLHHWNTPPLSVTGPYLARVPARDLSCEMMTSKMISLIEAGRDYLGYVPTSFRMGRWDIHDSHWNILAECGIKADASVRPLHYGFDSGRGPDHFSAPTDPYWIHTDAGRIFEVPLTVAPLAAILPLLMSHDFLIPLRSTLPKWGALVLQPVYHPLWLLKLTTMMHALRGGRYLSMTWHSSEMMPGGAPHMADNVNVARFLEKMENYFDWLENSYVISYATISEARIDAEKRMKGTAARYFSSGDFGREVVNV